MHLPFVKYEGCGNDFILFDNRKGKFPQGNPKVVQKLCHRQFGVGADGVILLENSDKADFRMRIFNADGSEAEMCGNGIRCLVQWYDHLHKRQPSYKIETMERLHLATVHGSHVCIDMGAPTNIEWNAAVQHGNMEFLFQSLSTGVPHAVLFVDDIHAHELKHFGPAIRHHPRWQPKGTNVNLAQRMDEKLFHMRTYERGVEAETLACGTGATAVALAAAHRFSLEGPLKVQMPAGLLEIGFQRNQTGAFSDITLTGPAKCTYQGIVEVD